jgi:lipopolysaccharide export system protein LptC
MSTFALSRRRQDRMVAWMPLIFLAMLAVIAWWLEATLSREVVQRNKPPATSPEQFLETFTALRYDPTGALTQELNAKRGTYFPELNRTVVEQPKFSQTAPNTAPLAVRSDKAVLHGRNERIDFSGGVRAQQQSFNDQPARVFETDQLTAVPATGELTTQSAVKITQADATVESQGLRANTKNQTFSGQGPARIILQPK